MATTTAKAALNALLAEGKALEARGNYTKEEADALRARLPDLVKAACDETHAESGAVMPPSYCRSCAGKNTCVLGGLVGFLGGI